MPTNLRNTRRSLQSRKSHLPGPTMQISKSPQQRNPYRIRMCKSKFRPSNQRPQVQSLQHQRNVLSNQYNHQGPIHSNHFIKRDTKAHNHTLLLPQFPTKRSKQCPQATNHSFPCKQFLDLLAIKVTKPNL